MPRKTNNPPEYTHKFFWDVEPTKLNVNQDYYFILERLLEYGNDPALKWLMSHYTDSQRLAVIKKSKKISKKTASLWQNYYSLNREEIKCFQKSYQKTDNPFWNY